MILVLFHSNHCSSHGATAGKHVGGPKVALAVGYDVASSRQKERSYGTLLQLRPDGLEAGLLSFRSLIRPVSS